MQILNNEISEQVGKKTKKTQKRAKLKNKHLYFSKTFNLKDRETLASNWNQQIDFLFFQRKPLEFLFNQNMSCVYKKERQIET